MLTALLSSARPQALEKFHVEKDIAMYIKKEFDRKYSATWHCVAGKSFGGCPSSGQQYCEDGTFCWSGCLYKIRAAQCPSLMEFGRLLM